MKYRLNGVGKLSVSAGFNHFHFSITWRSSSALWLFNCVYINRGWGGLIAFVSYYQIAQLAANCFCIILPDSSHINISKLDENKTVQLTL